jgi:hypothetical protein
VNQTDAQDKRAKGSVSSPAIDTEPFLLKPLRVDANREQAGTLRQAIRASLENEPQKHEDPPCVRRAGVRLEKAQPSPSSHLSF